MATVFIFLMHGCWDALISLVSYFVNESKNSNADMIGGSLFGVIILIGIIYIVISVFKIRKVLKNNKEWSTKDKSYVKTQTIKNN